MTGFSVEDEHLMRSVLWLANCDVKHFSKLVVSNWVLEVQNSTVVHVRLNEERLVGLDVGALKQRLGNIVVSFESLICSVVTAPSDYLVIILVSSPIDIHA